MRQVKITVVFLLLGFAASAHGQKQAGGKPDFRLHFHEGDVRRVQLTEILRLMMHFPQVEAGDAKPSVRTSNYSFTETVEKLLPDGSAIIGASLDSFTTTITIGEGKDAEDFFHFNSAVDWDIQHTFHDIKTLPRAQFLGQTIRFTMRPDGTVHDFQNLSAFHDNAVGKGYDYDVVHAMLSLSDSLRVGQMLELGAGGLAGLEGTYRSSSTATEISILREVHSRLKDNHTLVLRAKYSNPPARIEYLEGIATPMGIMKFEGGGSGELTFKDGFIANSRYCDTANVVLAVDVDTVPEEITRVVTTEVSSVPVLRGNKITVKEIESHRGIVKRPPENEPDIILDPATGKFVRPSKRNALPTSGQDSTVKSQPMPDPK